MAESRKEFYLDFEVKFGKHVVSVELPASSTIRDLKQKLEEQTHVHFDKQRLLFNLPVMKTKHRDPASDTTLRLLFPEELANRFEQHKGPVAQHMHVGAMLLGSAEAAPTVNVAATSEISRLVATTVEYDGKWFRCSYAKGYLRQTAYVCRTCVNEGRADPQHALCLACAEFCHGNHEVEEWGLRNYMRCDCCTQKCWRPPADPDAAAKAALERRMLANSSTSASTGGAASGVHSIQAHDIEQRTVRKRSRSTSPMTPKRSRGSSPVGGIRITTVPPAEMPAVKLHPSVTAEAPTASSPLMAPQTLSGDSGRPSASSSSSAFPTLPQTQLIDSSVGTADTRRGAPVGAPDVSIPCREKELAGGAEHAGVEKEGEEEGLVEGEVGPAPPVPPPELTRCAFVVDSRTTKTPVESVLPRNRENRYPRDAQNWCYCKNPHPSDDPDCGGIACMLCCSCFWSTHITKLHTRQYRRMPCYGDVLLGDTVAFRCNTCDTHVCVPCRYRCHKDHDIAPDLLTPSRDDGTDNGAAEGARFSCGCRGLCAIAEEVPSEMIDDLSSYDPIPDTVAVQLMNDDVFTGFVCAYCMQEYPWMASEDPRKCYGGKLSPRVLSTKPVVACGTQSTGTQAVDLTESEVFPFHGMLLPANAFTNGMTCSCEPCRNMFEKFAPYADKDATEMIMELHDYCDNCRNSIKDKQAFLCRTCEMKMDETFFICSDCNALRERKVQHAHCIHASNRPAGDGLTLESTASVGHATLSERAGAGQEGETASEAVESGAGENTRFEDAQGAGVYDHDLSHEFLEDTIENMYTLCGMQMLQEMGPEMHEYAAADWSSTANQLEVVGSLSRSLGQIPLEFSEEDLREMTALNRVQADTPKPQPRQ